jgi:hypothetical protein
VGWNGCTEQYPSTTIYACWGQQEGGYGDGLGTATTGGNWTFSGVNFHDNTQDGLDLRYANGTGKVTVLRSHFSGNAGNQVKTQGPTVIQNSVIVGNCANFNGKYYMTSGDNCRANGTAVYMVTSPGALASLSYNTIIGQGDCLIGPDEGSSTSEVDVYNNVLIGEPLWNDSSKNSCMFWWGNPPTGKVNILGNVVWNTRYYTTYPSGNTYADPKLTSETMSTFNPLPLQGSPAIDKGSTVLTVTTDFAGDARPVGLGYDIGAMEYGSSPVTPPPTSPPPPTKPPRKWRTGGAEPARLIGSTTSSASEPARQVSTEQSSARKVTRTAQQQYSLGEVFRRWLGLETAAR